MKELKFKRIPQVIKIYIVSLKSDYSVYDFSLFKSVLLS